MGPSLTGAAGASAAARRGPREETRTLDELYRDAVAEGGKLVIYAGGDVSSQADGVRAGFQAQFPEIDLTIVIDYSKFHDVRIDNQLATGTLVPDLVQLQTVQDFTRWKSRGTLLPYKPAGFSKIHPAFRDQDGAWVAIMVIAFSYLTNPALAGSQAPKTPHEVVDPRWKGQIASTYPHDANSSRSWALRHPYQPLTLAERAEHSHMSLRTFARRFTEEVGMSPGRWLIQQRIDGRGTCWNPPTWPWTTSPDASASPAAPRSANTCTPPSASRRSPGRP